MFNKRSSSKVRRLLGGARPAPPPPPNIRSSLALRLTRLSPLLLLAAALLALAVFFMPGGQPAQAQDTQSAYLVSNLNQTDATPFTLTHSTTSGSQGFRTGSNSAGYTLSSIEVNVDTALNAAAAANVRAELWSANADGSPNARLETLTVPSTLPAGTNAFTAPLGTVLTPETTYHLVIYTTASQTIVLAGINEDTEDSGAAPGWSIADAGYILSSPDPASPGGNAWGTYPLGDSYKIAVKGVARAAGSGTPRADGSTEYWSGTLTAKAVYYGFGCGFRTGQPQCSAQLSDDDFMYHGTEYTIELLHVSYGDTLQLILSGVPSAPNDGDGSGPERSRMALNVWSEQFLVKDAMISYGAGEGGEWTKPDAWVLTWTGSGLSWSENASISLSLVTLPAGGL